MPPLGPHPGVFLAFQSMEVRPFDSPAIESWWPTSRADIDVVMDAFIDIDIDIAIGVDFVVQYQIDQAKFPPGS